MTGEGKQGAAVIDERPWYVANELLALLIELLALGLLCWWGFATGDNAGFGVLLGLGTPAAAAALWWLFAAPRARFRPALPGVLLVKALVLGGGAVALYGVGHPVAAVVVAVVTAANITVAEAFRRSPPGGDREPAGRAVRITVSGARRPLVGTEPGNNASTRDWT
ncbi:YrdB family protein [Streptomyces sp. AC512_CC834]|uniref:YrdB family protein n=1 Tax=Streptomyces sp. AC512_CC834 TaxID=2823691 RepID=UPI0027E54B0C|nr:YrdB family protein [Streptomyces sp. AC512_CC834]